MEIDLRQLLRALRRWWWVALIVPFGCGILAYLYSARQEPLYAAEANLLINPAASSGTLDYNSVLTAERLAKTYQRLAINQKVLSDVISQLTLPLTVEELATQITATAGTDTQLLTLRVSDTSPERAALIANAAAESFRAYVRDLTAQSSEGSQATLDAEIARLEAEINEADAKMKELEARPDAASPSVQAQIAALRAKLDNLEPTYGSLLALRGQINTTNALAGDRLTIAVPATAPSAPYAPRKALNVLLGLIAGGLIAAGLILLLEYLDNTVKATSNFGSLLGAPLLSTVGAVPKLAQGRQQLFVLEQPKGSAAESIRLLRTNIEFASATREIAILAVTSPNPGEGKSTVAANLAVTLAQAGFHTALLDADLRRPTQHRVFAGANDRGLSTLLSAPDRPWTWAAQTTMLPNLTLVPAGPLPPNPADLLSLERMRELLAEMRQSFDVIVIDTPPVLAVSDPLIVAAHVDGLLLVTRAGKTRVDQLKRTAQTLQTGAIRLLGVIVNQQSGRGAEGYYYAEYHAVGEADSPRGSRRRGRTEAPPSLPHAEQAGAD